jgi:hypothetical protein
MRIRQTKIEKLEECHKFISHPTSSKCLLLWLQQYISSCRRGFPPSLAFCNSIIFWTSLPALERLDDPLPPSDPVAAAATTSFWVHTTSGWSDEVQQAKIDIKLMFGFAWSGFLLLYLGLTASPTVSSALQRRRERLDVELTAANKKGVWTQGAICGAGVDAPKAPSQE